MKVSLVKATLGKRMKKRIYIIRSSLNFRDRQLVILRRNLLINKFIKLNHIIFSWVFNFALVKTNRNVKKKGLCRPKSVEFLRFWDLAKLSEVESRLKYGDF